MIRAPIALAAGILFSCEREARRFQEPPAFAVRSSSITTEIDPYGDNAWGTAQGKQLYVWYNCSGCHSNGGGGMGPPLIDDKWIYGRAPEKVYETIARGRPNGMPAYGSRIPAQHVWYLVSYVRSMSGAVRMDVAPGRNDAIQSTGPEAMKDTEPEVPDHGAVSEPRR